MPTRTMRTLTLLALLSLPSPLFADLITLKDGRSFNGSLQRVGDFMVITTDDHKTVTVPPSAIDKVTLQGPQTSSADAAASAWNAATAAISHALTFDAVLKIHKDFLAKYSDQPISADVRASLAACEKLAPRHPVRFRGKWLAPEDIQKQKDAWLAAAEHPLAAYKALKFADARNLALDLAAADPSNPIALEIAGLASCKLNDLPKARQYFTRLSAMDPDNALAENNLAVISFMQQLQPEALIHYTRALQSRPDNRQILDNAASAIGLYKASKDSDAYRNLLRQYNAAEQPMEEAMADKHLYRDGGFWVTKDQRDKRAASKQETLTAMAALDAKFAVAKQSRDLIAQKLQAVQSDYDNTVSQLNNVNVTSIHSGPNNFAPDNFAYQRGTLTANLENLASQKADLTAQLNTANAALTPFYAQADRLKAQLATATEGQFANPQILLDIGQDDNPPPLPGEVLATAHVPDPTPTAGPPAPKPAQPPTPEEPPPPPITPIAPQ